VASPEVKAIRDDLLVQKLAVEQWWTQADPVTRTRALRLEAADLLPEDMQVDLAMAGVTVSAVGCGWDQRPTGYWVPQVLWDFLRGRAAAG
jgi:hypothetical protein